MRKKAVIGAAAAVLSAALGLTGCGKQGPGALLQTARASLEKGDSAAAVIHLKNALQQDPGSAQARLLLGMALLREAEPEAAAVELEKALSAGAPKSQVLPALARAMVDSGRGKSAIARFSPAEVEGGIAVAELQTALADAWRQQKDRAQAKKALDAALAVVADYPPAVRVQAEMEAEEGRSRDSLAMLDRLVAAMPHEAQAWRLRGDVLLGTLQDGKSAIDSYRRALAEAANDKRARVGLIQALLLERDLKAAGPQVDELSKVWPNHPQTLHLRTELEFLKGNYASALDGARELVQRSPENVHALVLAGMVEYSAGSLVDARRLLGKVIHLEPGIQPARILLARTYFKDGQLPKCLETLQPLLDSSETPADAAALAGEAYLQLGDRQRAIESFSRAAQADPKNVKRRVVLAVTQKSSGSLAGATQALESLAAQDQSRYAQLGLFGVKLKARDFEGAMKALDAIETGRRPMSWVSYLRALVAQQRNDQNEVVRQLEEALARDPAYVPASIALAQLDVGQRRFQQAEKRFAGVLKADPANLQALMAIAGIRDRAGRRVEDVTEVLLDAVKRNPSQPAPRLALIEYYLVKRQAGSALSTAQDSVATLPDDLDLLNARGRAELAGGDANKAAVTFSQEIAKAPDQVRGYLQLASIDLSKGRLSQAEQGVRNALRIDPRSLVAQNLAVDIGIAQKRHAFALEVARQVQAQRPREYKGFEMEGRVEEARHDFGAAIRVYRAGLKVVPESALAMRLHHALRVAMKSDEAEAFAVSWLREHDKDVEFMTYLGHEAMAAQRYADAERYYSAVLKLMPNNVTVMNNLAWAGLQLHRPDALAMAQRASELASPPTPAIMDTLAAALAADRQFSKAIAVQQEAVRLSGGDPDFRLALAKLYVASGDRPRARSELDELSSGGKAFKGQAEVAALRASLR